VTIWLDKGRIRKNGPMEFDGNPVSIFDAGPAGGPCSVFNGGTLRQVGILERDCPFALLRIQFVHVLMRLERLLGVLPWLDSLSGLAVVPGEADAADRPVDQVPL
jgi:hypothetical protein